MKKKKIIKRVIIAVISLIILLILATALVFQFVVKPYSKELVTAVDQLLQDEEFVGDLFDDLPPASDSEITEQAPSTAPESGEVSEDLSQYHVDEDGSLVSPGQDNTPSGPSPQPKKPQKEYNNTYDYVKDNVSSADFNRGVSFASRIDIQYVLGLLKGGLTVPEKRELKAYLKERFTTAEINEGIALYNKYSYLLK